MVCMGIDFGERCIGIALSDDRGKIAFPHAVLSNDEHSILNIASIVTSERVARIIVGDTRTESGKENPITGALNLFLINLSRVTKIAAISVPEIGTTAAARALLLEAAPRGTVASPAHREEGISIDARAAAVILQRFLDSNPK